ncbi:hypothetical protein GCG54_00013204 [Colletotrichum gloeosporioides]|uniref:F-box domain-containing protein n=1 Tax=Colletotrichum gloeosporioides TaxID=474922 RepID=A0A8H4C6R8_COLGL|nr:uncharacterized protein GCG54_00013204 [Colletotrichum gloeosporioides]KAF3798463.1 hypothetical protein GCG54_00013204 [Colletotrichum gloeosporioides]
MVRTQGQTARIVARRAPSNGQLRCLPSELIARIVENLDLDSIKSFRLAGRFTAAQCLIPPFLRFYSNQSTSLTPRDLEHLIERTSSKTVSRAVKHITVHATKFAAMDCGNDDERLVAELATALRNVGALGCLEISPQERRFRKCGTKQRRPEWQPADAREFQSETARAGVGLTIVMSAVARSGVSINELKVFCSPVSYGSVVQTVFLTNLLPKLSEKNSKFEAAVKDVEKLSISLGTRRNPKEVPLRLGSYPIIPYLSATDRRALAKENFPGLAGLLGYMHNLKTLEIHLHNTLKGKTFAYSELFDLVADQVKLQNLRQLTLDMVPVSEASFLKFLANSPDIEDLSLRFVHIRQGSWESFMSKITNPLTKLQLDCISDDGRESISLWPDGLPRMQEEELDVPHDDGENVNASSLDSAKNLHKRDFNTEEIRQGLVFR